MTTRRFLTASLVLALAAGCSKESDGAFSRSDGEAQAYAAAIATVARFDDPGRDDDLPLSAEAADCYGTAYVEVLGVERLAAEVTPEEIEANPEREAADWGVELTAEDGVEIFRGLVDCEPAILRELGQSVAAGMAEGRAAAEFDADCLGDVDPSTIEDLMGASIAGGEGYVPTAEEAAGLVDWLMGCGDVRVMYVAAFESDPSFPAGTVECIDESLDDGTVRDLMIASMAAGADEIAEDTPEGEAFVDLVRDCTAG